MDLSHLADSFLTSVSTEATNTGSFVARIGMRTPDGTEVTLVLSDVARLCIDGGDLHNFVGDIVVCWLPRFGPWPAEARHLLGHHDNCTELTWLRLDGPTEIEVLAADLRVETVAEKRDRELEP